jgi:fructose transport system ATP-binding protein
VILISHNMSDVWEVADRVHIKRHGRSAGVIRPADTGMEDAVAVMTGAFPVLSNGSARSPSGAWPIVPGEAPGVARRRSSGRRASGPPLRCCDQGLR